MLVQISCVIYNTQSLFCENEWRISFWISTCPEIILIFDKSIQRSVWKQCVRNIWPPDALLLSARTSPLSRHRILSHTAWQQLYPGRKAAASAMAKCDRSSPRNKRKRSRCDSLRATGVANVRLHLANTKAQINAQRWRLTYLRIASRWGR